MNEALLTCVLAFPFLAALFARSAFGPLLGMIAATLAFFIGIAHTQSASVRYDWILMGMELGLHGVDRWFMSAAGLLWFAGSLYAMSAMHQDPRRQRFWVFYLLAMAGNFTLILGQDLMTFYFGFTVMGLASYGLVIHTGKRDALFAGKVYLVMTLIGEFALFAGLILLHGGGGSSTAIETQLLLVLAFGIKAGLFGLHMWLPLAHPAAPIPASAVLSGVMIKAALLGLIRFLPFGNELMPVAGLVMLVLGVASIIFASAIGALQSNLKTVLAYSSISKMGLLVAALGVAAMEPTLSSPIILGVAIFALHHGVAKASLFFTIGMARSSRSSWRWLAVIPIFSMIGLPFTSGASAKTYLKQVVPDANDMWVEYLWIAMTLSLIGTVCLMCRFLVLLARERTQDAPAANGIVIAWSITILSGIVLAPVLGVVTGALDDLLWILVASVLCGVLIVYPPRPVIDIPAGDILFVLMRLGKCLRSTMQAREYSLSIVYRWRSIDSLKRLTTALEAQLSSYRLAALMWLFILLSLFLIPLSGSSLLTN